MERQPSTSITNVKVTRRGFLGGGAASLATAGVAAKLGFEHVASPDLLDREASATPTAEDVLVDYESYNQQSESGYFMADVERYAAGFAAEVPEVLENIDIYSAIQENFFVPNIKHDTLRKNLEVLAPALAFVESRYKNAQSEVGAFGVMQLMPGTWEELCKEDEDKDDVIVQIQVAARLMEQSYSHVMSSCASQLELIKHNFFGGDSDLFETEYLTPLFINSYNAGMGSMEKLIKEFAELCPNPVDTVELFEQSETLTGYDVFIAMAHTGNHRGWAAWYKDEASNYTCKVYGAHTAVATYFTQQAESDHA